MAAKKLQVLLLYAYFLSSRLQDVVSSDLLRNTTGGLVRGRIITVAGFLEIEQYLSIPYAESPTGVRRWKSPKPHTGWRNREPLNATILTEGCPRLALLEDPSAAPDAILGNEDCLVLNIFAQHKAKNVDKPKQKEPVMIFIHGGSWIFGSSGVFIANAIARLGVVVVTFNYRLGALGFMNADNTKFPLNLGIQDQVAALEWVQNNIGNFGGDKNRVTIFGESAGAVSVTLLAISNENLVRDVSDNFKPRLFQRVIAQSGNVLSSIAFALSYEENKEKFIRNTSCRNLPVKRITNCLNRLNYSDIVLSQSNIRWGPAGHAESSENFLRRNKNNFEGIYDFMFGFNKFDVYYTLFNEISEIKSFETLKRILTNFFAPHFKDPEKVTDKAIIKYSNLLDNDLKNDSNAWKHIASNIIRDFAAAVPTLKYANIASSRNGLRSNSYMYYFVHEPPKDIVDLIFVNSRTNSTGWAYGARHGEELAYVFGAPLNTKGATLDDLTISLRMIQYWTNFAKTGNPNDGIDEKPYWPRYNSSTSHYMVIGKETDQRALFRTGDKIADDTFDFWTKDMEIYKNTKDVNDTSSTMQEQYPLVYVGGALFVVIFLLALNEKNKQ